MRVFGQDERNKVSSLRYFIQRRCLAPLTRSDGDERVRSSRYCKIPQQQLLNLSVLKLDGSEFDVLVARNGTVADLKRAIEEVFSSSPDEGHCKITWSLVWAHFCLCYEEQKLTDDKAGIRSFGIKDGDQLYFIRHMSINYSPLNRYSKSPSAACKQQSMLSLESNIPEENQWTGLDYNDKHGHQVTDATYFHEKNCEEASFPEFKLANLFKGWFSYSRLWGDSKNVSESRIRPSRFSFYSLRGGGQSEMIRLQGN